MATFEDREIIDYTIKKLEKVLEPENFMIKDLDKMHNRLKRMEERLREIIKKIKDLENKIRFLEEENISFFRVKKSIFFSQHFIRIKQFKNERHRNKKMGKQSSRE